MTPFVTAGAGFLLAVLWFDLMFDVQVLRRQEPSDEAVGSIAFYSRRVTTAASPMNRLVGLVMLGTIAALVAQLAGDDAPSWVAASCLALTVGATGLAASRTFRRAARLGMRRDSPAEQARLARLMLRDHLLCLAAIVSVLALQLGFAR